MNETKRDGIQLLSDLYLHRGNPLPWLEEDAVFVIVAGNLAPIQQPRCLRAAAAHTVGIICSNGGSGGACGTDRRKVPSGAGPGHRSLHRQHDSE